MSAEETKKNFAEICECIWEKIEQQNDLDEEMADSMRNYVTNFAMVAWNTCLTNQKYADVKKTLEEFAEKHYDSHPCALTSLLHAAELKWLDYRNDNNIIVHAQVEMIDGKPQAVAYLKGECPEAEAALEQFHEFMNSPEVQERLENVSPEDAEEEISRLVAEYNASQGFPLPFMADDDIDTDEYDEYDGYEEYEGYQPIDKKELLELFLHIQLNFTKRDKRGYIREIIESFPFLSLLSNYIDEYFRSSRRGKTPEASIPELMIAVYTLFVRDTIVPEQEKETFKQFSEEAKALTEDFIRNKDDFYNLIQIRSESAMLEFIAEKVSEFNLPAKDFKRVLSTLLTWGIILECARESQNAEFEESAEEFGPESYDFDTDTIKVLQLHVKLLDFRVSADLLIREDSTFAELHRCLLQLFKREEDHLYRFECEDGCTVVSMEEEAEDADDTVPADQCFIGHHLSKEYGAYYLFDYDDEWEHEITVKKTTLADAGETYPKILKIKGNIPEQYPEEGEES